MAQFETDFHIFTVIKFSFNLLVRFSIYIINVYYYITRNKCVRENFITVKM